MAATEGSEGAAARSRLDTTVSKALKLFESLVGADAPQGLSTLSKEVGLQKSNVHRLLHTLSALGYVDQEPDTKRYYPTLKAWELGATVVRRSVLRLAARPILIELHRKTTETTFLSILSGTHTLYLDSIIASHSFQSAPESGQRVAAIRSASGRAMLAHHADPARALKMVGGGLSRIESQALLKQFQEIRDMGYCASASALRRGVNAVAAPLLLPGGDPHIAVGVTGPEDSITPARFAELGQQVLIAASRISELPRQSGRSLWAT